MGWSKEQQDKPAEDREVTSSHLMALNSLFPTTMGRAEPVSYRGWIFVVSGEIQAGKIMQVALGGAGENLPGRAGNE